MTEGRNSYAIPPYNLSGRDWRQFEHTTMLCSFRDFTSAQSQPDDVGLFRIFHRKIGRPAGVILDEFNRNLGRVAALMNEFDDFPDHRIFRRVEKKSERAMAERIASARTSETGGIRCAIPPDGLLAQHLHPLGGFHASVESKCFDREKPPVFQSASKAGRTAR
jgi:hypothetical protein